MEFKIELWLHAILIVDKHQNLIAPAIKENVYGIISNALLKRECGMLEIGGTENHVHVLFSMNPEISLDELLKKLKLSTEFEIQQTLLRDFLWEEGYYAYSVGTDYIETEKFSIQKEPIKHRTLLLEDELKKLREDLDMNESDELTDLNEHTLN